MKLIFVAFMWCIGQGLQAQEKLTTVILVRHAEKENDGSKNPELSEAGKKRALVLANMFSKAKIDAIYSTNFKRTEATVAPLASQHSLPITHYDGAKPAEVDEMISKWKGGTILICGHSNTTPAIINRLIGKEEYKTFDDGDYSNLIILTFASVGDAKITWLRY
ncbi:MAG: SixA phosphatase family protein [Flammeovirgaceae bacterium]